MHPRILPLKPTTMLKKIALFIGLALLVSAWQTPPPYTFEGTVLDKDSGSPLIGANVLIKGTTEGTVTDFDGKYSLTYHKKNVTLVISYVGYKTEEVKAAAGKEQTVALSVGETELMEEIVVGYGQAQRAPAMMRSKRMPATAGYVPGVMDSGPPHNTEDYDVINENRFFEVTKEPLSTFSIDVDAASYSNIRRFLRNGQQPPKDAVRIEEMVNYFNYDYPEPEGEHPFTVNTEISECPWQPQHRLLHVGLQGKHIPMDDLPASNLVFLIDVSGSMSATNKLPLLQSSFKLLADQLRPKDKVAIVVYAGAAGVVLKPTGGDDKQKIKDAIHQLEAGGSTAGGAGIQLAYKMAKENFVEGGNNRVILATDGDFNVGPSSDAELVRMIEAERESGVFLTILGFGMGNYKDNKMQQLANKGNGNHAYIDDISEAKKVLIEEFGGTMFAIAKDVKIQIEFNPAKVRGYRLIGYENRLLANEDFNDDKKDAGELGSGHTVTALYEIIPAGVDSEHLAQVDDLKYQETKIDPNADRSKELLTIKLRYKAPNGQKSRLIEEAVLDRDTKLEKSSDNFRWSAAVAEFGMLLRDSEYKGKATYLHCQQMAENAKGEDPNGYRRELIEMIDTMKRLADPEVVGNE